MSKSSSFLGQEVTYNEDENTLVHFHSEQGGGAGNSSRFGGGSTAPTPTLVHVAGSNLEFNLIWDSSVSNLGINKSAFMSAVQNVATYYASHFTTAHTEIINIKVGWGEIAGGALPAGALGASETNGYLTNYATVTNGLINNSGGHVTAASFNANEPTGAQFFISSAEAKGFGLISGTSTSVDGYMGFGTLANTGYSWNFASDPTTGQGSALGATQFSFQGVVQHEISEVMGRIEMEGHTSFNGKATYTPLDLFNFDKAGELVLSNGDNSGTQVNSYFSLDSGTTAKGYFNDGYQGGDIADWASWNSPSQSQTDVVHAGDQDSFDAFGYPQITTDLSGDDQLVMDTLGVWSTGLIS